MDCKQINKRILITGGAGFIGSHLLNLFCNKYSHYQVINLDCLTYAGNLDNIAASQGLENYHFEKVDIVDRGAVISVFEKYKITDVVHLAAESHVDQSIENPGKFIQTNIIGTQNLLDAAKQQVNFEIFYHVSTDEVFGALGREGSFNEETPYNPRSPYSASKASSDHLVRAYSNTYGLKHLISNCSNNYGPHQFTEKLIPVVIRQILERKQIPVYGRGENIRDWLFVGDHVEAIDTIFHSGKINQTYCIGGGTEVSNLKIVELLCDLMDEMLGLENSKSLIDFVKDRAGHDFRYSIEGKKLEKELGWRPKQPFMEGLKQTINFYVHKNEKK